MQHAVGPDRTAISAICIFTIAFAIIGLFNRQVGIVGFRHGSNNSGALNSVNQLCSIVLSISRFVNSCFRICCEIGTHAR